MANNCYNYGYFTGSVNQIKKLVAALNTERIKEINLGNQKSLFEGQITLYAKNYGSILGEAEEYKDFGFDTYIAYGSRWFECSWEYDKGENNLIISGDSAWSPVLPFFVKLCKAYKLQCEGEYSESGMDFAGTFIIDSEGNVEENQMSYGEYEAEHNPDSFWQNAMYSIQEGDFEDFDSVISHFHNARWQVDKSEIDELKEAFDQYLDRNKDE